MSSQASSAGRDEAKVREQLVKTGHVDIMVDIRGNFFYTRTVPCQLWFLNKNKPAHLKNKVLMLDARNVYRKVTRKIFDFSPEQQQNLTAVVWLYRSEGNRFIELVRDYVDKAIFEARYCQFSHLYNCAPVPDFIEQLGKLSEAFQPFMDKLEQDGINVEPYVDFLNAKGLAEDGWSVFQVLTNDLQKWWNQYEKNDAPSLLEFIDKDACLKDLAWKRWQLARRPNRSSCASLIRFSASPRAQYRRSYRVLGEPRRSVTMKRGLAPCSPCSSRAMTRRSLFQVWAAYWNSPNMRCLVILAAY